MIIIDEDILRQKPDMFINEFYSDSIPFSTYITINNVTSIIFVNQPLRRDYSLSMMKSSKSGELFNGIYYVISFGLYPTQNFDLLIHIDVIISEEEYLVELLKNG